MQMTSIFDISTAELMRQHLQDYHNISTPENASEFDNIVEHIKGHTGASLGAVAHRHTNRKLNQ